MVDKKKPNAGGGKDEGRYTDLPGAVKGEVVVRFPPEASGYLHIGHAKAALLNNHYKEIYDGKLVFRFDDTNPAKEKEDFEKVIEEDLEMLQVKPDVRSYTSDHFELMLNYCEELMKKGLAYVDDTPAEQMKQEREKKIESKNRSNSVEHNLKMWQEMKNASKIGETFCVRAKIDMNSNNGCLRDPTIYRCKKESHPRTGNKYNVYPTYDFACPIVDSVENVTHALRTTEYVDRDIQYQWFQNALGVRNTEQLRICSYARLNMMNTVLSKRKLTWFVDEKLVDGWDDPRMPTVRGVLRRGMTVEGLKQFIVAQGSSRSAVYMDWDKIWSFNRKVIDSNSPRFMAVEAENCVSVLIHNQESLIEKGEIKVKANPKVAELGEYSKKIGSKIFIDQIDASTMKVGDKVTLMNWGNVELTDIKKNGETITEISARLKLEDTDFKKTAKVTWVAEDDYFTASLKYYEHLIGKPILGKDEDFKSSVNLDSLREVRFLVDKAFIEQNLMVKGKIVQFMRRGFFILDEELDEKTMIFTSKAKPAVFIAIPDGSTDLNVFPVAVQAWKKSLREKYAPVEQVNQGKEQKKKEENKDKKKDGDKKTGKGGDSKPKKDEVKPKKDEKKVDNKKPVTKQNEPPVKVEKGEKDLIVEGIEIIEKNIIALRKVSADSAIIDENTEILRSLKSRLDELNSAPKKAGKVAEVAKATKVEDSGKAEKGAGDVKPKGSGKKEKPEQKPKQSKPNEQQKGGGGKKISRLGLESKKSENFANWYTEVIIKSELIEYYDISGCYILRPWCYSIWKAIRAHFDSRITALGISECMFPMFVSRKQLEKEQTHIDDFAAEVAWVTRSGSSDLAEPIAIRPTSETVMYPYFAKWIKSHRDLPLRLNQWTNPVRWEFKNPTPFIRTREFLWQEGHTAHETREGATTEVMQILEYYAEVYEYLLAVPVVRGRKSEKEKFAGSDFSTTVEGYVPQNGRGIQAATSHHLGQNFSKMFDIVYQDPQKPDEKCFVYQNSWGLSTRSIGAMIMIHSDDHGLVLPPRVAPLQVIIIPCGITASSTKEEKEKLLQACRDLKTRLTTAGVRSDTDLSEHNTPGWKFNHWELKGVPIRAEIGPKDLAKNEFVAVRRDKLAKSTISLEKSEQTIEQLLLEIQSNLYDTAKEKMDSHMILTEDWKEFTTKLDQRCILLSPFCGLPSCEDEVKKLSAKNEMDDFSGGPIMGAKTLCIPFKQPKEIDSKTKCIRPGCSQKPKEYALFGRSY